MPKPSYKPINHHPGNSFQTYHVRADYHKELFTILYEEPELYEFVMCLNSNQHFSFHVPRDVPTEGINESNIVCTGWHGNNETLTNEEGGVSDEMLRADYRRINVYKEFVEHKVSYTFFVMFLLYMNSLAEEYGASIFEFDYDEDKGHYEVCGRSEMEEAKKRSQP